MPTPDADPSATLEHIRVGAESEIVHPDDECGVAAGGFCTPHGALVLVAALEAVLELHRPDGLNREYEPCEAHGDVQASCPGCRVVDTVICWQKGCEDYGWPCPTYRAITRALNGETGA